MTDGSTRLSLPEAIQELSSTVLGSSTSIADVLDHAVRVAQRTIPGAVEVSITMQNGHPTTVAASGKLAVIVDEQQYDTGQGPCLQALRQGEPISVDDQTTDSRWPEYSARAVACGVGSSFSLPLVAGGETIGAFNSYALTPHAFDEGAKATAENLAAYAGVVLNNAALYFDASSRAGQLEQAMRSRAVIEQAKGILMGSRHCDADEAFTILVKLSQDSHRKLHDVACAVVDESIKPA
jgi:GAF domain-containing protein